MLLSLLFVTTMYVDDVTNHHVKHDDHDVHGSHATDPTSMATMSLPYKEATAVGLIINFC